MTRFTEASTARSSPSRSIGLVARSAATAATFALGFLFSTGASALTIDFIELANGDIQLVVDGTTTAVKSQAENFHLSSPAIPPGYPADATQSRIGISRTSSGYLFALQEAGGAISDYVWVYQFINQFTVIDFFSDDDSGNGLTLPAGLSAPAILETGDLQVVGSYTNDRGETVTLRVQSDVDVPAPPSLALLGLGLMGFAWSRRRKA